jgi:site-specific recombinase XerD
MSSVCRKRGLWTEGPFAPFLQSYSIFLVDQGFSQVAFYNKTFVVSQFSRWLKGRNITLGEVTAEHERAFLRYSARRRRPKSGDSLALTDFRRWLQDNRVAAYRTPDPAKQSGAHRLLQEYSSFLQRERGLAATTIQQYVWTVGRFLRSTYGAHRVDLSFLRAKDVTDYVQLFAAGGRTFAKGKNITWALRSFLRFARYRGHTNTDLAAAVPAVAGWSMTSIPRAMPLKDVRRVLQQSKQRRTAVGLRDRAILLLLARLGLRAQEVSLLELADIDWISGCLRVSGKGREERPMPMPFDVGEAIAAYLRKGRQTTSCRRVFLRARAPVRGLAGRGAILAIVKRALAHAGVVSVTKGAHQFRHALATEMLRQGLNLTEIGQLLRHGSPDVTRRYAKVDLTSLRDVALPWPAGLS